MDIRQYIHSLMKDKRSGLIASFFKFFLFLASLLYFIGIKAVFFLRQNGILPTAHLEVKVISVGNLTLGGTGKTPLVELIANILTENSRRVAVLTRGYKLASKVLPKTSMREPLLFEQIGDEPALLRLKLPQINVLVSPDRIRSGRTAIYNYGADVLLLDDGFQYWALSRDIDILVIDAANPFGNGRLLPRGILREPIESLARANIIVITKANLATPEQIENIKKKIKTFNYDAQIFTSVHKPVKLLEFAGCGKLQTEYTQNTELPIDSINAKDVIAVCGIGDPDCFLKTLKGLGAVVKMSMIFTDHHPYVFSDLEAISAICMQAGVKTVVVTAKDMIKLKPLIQRHALAFESFQMQFLFVDIKLQILEKEDKFKEFLLSK